MSKIATPLRYPGGKSSLAGFLKLVFVRNQLLDGHYIEPYCGGAGIAMELLRSEFAGVVHLNDVDPAIYAFWWSVFNEPEALCERIHKAKLSVANWKRQRAVVSNPDSYPTIDLGFATFFLNRVNRSGILSAGPIGGYAQTGSWDMSARFNRDVLATMITGLSQYKERIVLSRSDAVKFLRRVVPSLPKRSLLYLDPPYVVKGQRLYLNSYTHRDHARIAGVVQAIDHVPWIVSYDNVEVIQSLYSGRRRIIYDIGYSASVRCVGSEIIVFSDALNLPNVPSPVSITGPRLRKLLAA